MAVGGGAGANFENLAGGPEFEVTPLAVIQRAQC